MSLQVFDMPSNALPRAQTHYNALKNHFKIPKVKKGERMTVHKALARKEEVFDHKSKTNIHTKSKNNISMSSTAPSELAYKVVMKQPIQRVWEPKMTRAQKIRSGQFKYDTRQLPKTKTNNKSIFNNLEKIRGPTVHKDINFKKLRQQLRQRRHEDFMVMIISY